MYKTEAEFSKSLSAKLKKAGFDVTRIESHGTGNGIPDMFVQGHGFDFWLELKNGKGTWRPGQVAWHYTYYLLHGKRKCSLTLRSVAQGIEVYPMVSTQPKKFIVSWEDWSKINLEVFFKMITNVWTGTTRDCAIALADRFNVDYDPEAYWTQEDLEQKVQQYQLGTMLLDCFELLKNQK